MKKAVCALAFVGLFAACAGDEGPEVAATDRADRTATSPDVKEAKAGTVNVPKEGTYTYEYESESSNAATPDATPRRSSPDAELSSEVSVDGDLVTIADKTTEGPAVATVKRRYGDDGIVELSFELEAGDSSSGCVFSKPIEVLPIPLETGNADAQPFAGRGNACEGERTVEVGDREKVEDADGVTWDTWKVTTTNVLRTDVGLTSRSTLTTWLSPDLGKEIRMSSVVEVQNAQGQTQQRGETLSVLKSHPT